MGHTCACVHVHWAATEVTDQQAALRTSLLGVPGPQEALMPALESQEEQAFGHKAGGPELHIV